MPGWTTSFVHNGFSTLQWPITSDSGHAAGLANVVSSGLANVLGGRPAEAALNMLQAADAAVSTALSATSATALVANQQVLRFPKYDAVVAANATELWLNVTEFTGRPGALASLLLVNSRDVGFVKGSPGQLDNPKSFYC